MEEWDNERLAAFLADMYESQKWTTRRQWWRAKRYCEMIEWVTRGGERLRTLTYPQLGLVTEWAVDDPYWTQYGNDSRRYQLVAIRQIPGGRTLMSPGPSGNRPAHGK
jgi:hypothetical protein